jgi:hypothetical protein
LQENKPNFVLVVSMFLLISIILVILKSQCAI